MSSTHLLIFISILIQTYFGQREDLESALKKHYGIPIHFSGSKTIRLT